VNVIVVYNSYAKNTIKERRKADIHKKST